jgi:hypothetical protein
MSTLFHRRSRAYLDQILDGRASGTDPLIDLVHQVQAPPRRRETLGLRTAASAFAWAPSVRPYLPLHHRTGLTSAAAHLWHPKLLVVAATLIAATTVAFATTGKLPTQIAPSSASGDIAAQLSAHATVSLPPALSPSDHGQSTPAAPGAAPPGATGPSGSSGPSGNRPSDSSTPTPSAPSGPLVSLCRQWVALPSGSEATEAPLFAFLIKLAGGVSGVDLFCDTLLSSGAPSPSHGATANSTGGPTQSPTAGPTATPTPTPTS